MDGVVALYFILSLVIVLILRRNYAKARGKKGEYNVKKVLGYLPSDKYQIINDLMINIDDKTIQIDHLVISKFGIFVIETKNFRGLIMGNEYNAQWTQILGEKHHKFYNPIHQNYGHVKALAQYFGIDETILIPIVCFSNEAELKIDCKSIVVNLDSLLVPIVKYQGKIFDEDINLIKENILKCNIENTSIRKNHTKKIRQRLNIKKKLINEKLCPKCGCPLVEKNGKYGKFYGCSRYPICKYTKNIEWVKYGNK